MVAECYSQAQVLHGLREVWKNQIGFRADFNAHTRIDLADDDWAEIDLADVFYRLEHFFGFSCSDQEWTDFFGFDIATRSKQEWEQTVAPRLTFGALAQFIADRAPVVASFEPITILDQNCATAGVFRGIQRVVSHIKRNASRFAPSAQILQVLRGKELDKFWTQLRWMTENTLPELPVFWRMIKVYAGWLGFVIVIGGHYCAWKAGELTWAFFSLFSAVALYVLASSIKWLINPLPSYMKSFRDLSRYIAESQELRTN